MESLWEGCWGFPQSILFCLSQHCLCLGHSCYLQPWHELCNAQSSVQMEFRLLRCDSQRGCDYRHVFFLGRPEKWDFHELRLKGRICFQLVMVRIQHEKYASQSIPRGFKELLIKKVTKRWLIRCWNHYKSDLWGILYFLWNLLSEKTRKVAVEIKRIRRTLRKLTRHVQQ